MSGRAAPSGLIAVEAQLSSVAQRHLQVRFNQLTCHRGDGWVLYQFPTISEAEHDLGSEVQQLCTALVRDVTGNSQMSLELQGEKRESNFSGIAANAMSFAELMRTSGDVGDILDIAALGEPGIPGMKEMLEILYQDVVSDMPLGLHSVKDFPGAMCPTGSRFDVLLKNTICVKAFSHTAEHLAPVISFGTDGDEDNNEDDERVNLDTSMLQNSYTASKFQHTARANIWIDTLTLARALSPYTNAGIESELPGVWRAKSFSLQEAGEVLRQVYMTLKEYWNSRRSQRTERLKLNAMSLLSIVSGDLRNYVKSHVLLVGSGWRGPWRVARQDLNIALQLLRDWSRMAGELTKVDWIDWDGGSFHDEGFDIFAVRLHDVVRIRNLISQSAMLNDAIPDTLQPEQLFNGVDMNDIGTSGFVQRWKRCLAAFEREMGFLEPSLRNRVKAICSGSPSDSQIRRLIQYSTLLRRDTIRSAVERDLEEVATYMKQQIDVTHNRFDSFFRRATTDLQRLRAAKSCQAECSRIPELARHLFGPGVLLDEVVAAARKAIDDTTVKEVDVGQQWFTLVESSCQRMVALEDAVTVQVSLQTGMLSCTVHPALHTFLMEVTSIRAWLSPRTGSGMLSEAAQNAISACENLSIASRRTQQSVANYNTVLQQMIPCTRRMLESAMKRATAQILFADTNCRVISLANHQELEGLNLRFQNAVESLSSSNRHIRRFHNEFISQVVSLHGVDLTKHMDQWRSAVDGMRSAFEEFLYQHRLENYDEWRRHWDCQIYKALEYQYRRGLESLHENMEELKVELVFKQGLVQFKPTFEAIREAYYVKVREFVSVPLRFRGLQAKREGKKESYEIYPLMPVVNNDRIITVHTKAIELFAKLNRVRKAFRLYITVGLCGTNGAPDLDSVVEQWSQQRANGGYVDGFRTVRDRQDKLNKIEDVMKVDCFSVSTIPVKASIDEQLHRVEESLLNSMRKSIQHTITDIDNFVFNASNLIERQPTTMDEVGLANKAYRECSAVMGDYENKLKELERQNGELRAHSGASIEMGATKSRWEHLREAMASHTKVIEASVSKMRVSLDGLIQKFLKDVQRFSTNWKKQKDQLLQAFGERKTESVPKMLAIMKDQINDLNDLKIQAQELEAKCDYFNQPKPNFTELRRTVKDVEATSKMWSMYDDFEDQLQKLRSEDWLTFRSHTYQFNDFIKGWKNTLESCDASANSKDSAIAEYLSGLLRDWEKVLSLLKVIRGDGWMTEHWNEMFRLIDIPKGMTSTELRFGDILDHHVKVIAKEVELKQLQSRAQGEIQLREALQDLRSWGLEAVFTLVTPTDLKINVKLITEWKEIMTQVSDNQALISSLKDSPFYVHFADEASAWEVKLTALAQALVLLNQIEQRWTYLQPIFARGALPQEQTRFKRVDKEFTGILREVEADPRVMTLASQIDLNDKLKTILEQTERCQKSLMEYLDAKRDKLPRFYFISDDDLLEILGHSQNPTIIQTHLKKLFMGIHTVEFNSDHTTITHMISANQERVSLIRAVPITGSDVEDWLILLDESMQATLHDLLVSCVEEKHLAALETVKRYPSQTLQVAQQILFCKHVEDAIGNRKLPELRDSLRSQLEHLTGLDDVDDVSRLKIKALILDIIHCIEIVELLLENNVKHFGSWHWQKQLRYTMDSKTTCWVHMTDTTFAYTYEYQGNAAKLVHTPLTDKCYLVLTKGMGLGYGGNPYGPAGTGKTESVKALGSAMGRQVLVFNCDEGIDFKSMGRIFVGIVKCGAWGCFDEFNRLKIDQLSAISQMIQVIQEALKNKEPNCPLLNKEVAVSPNAGIFVTLNPAGKGYGGRTKLPDNLKQLFREVAMSVPDNELITSTMLLSEGFSHARSISKNVVELYKLCGQLMSHQQHYDWGLRPLKAVLRLGGTLVQRWRKDNPGKRPSLTEETELMLQSLNVNTLSKLTFEDARLFSGLLRDIFPSVESRHVKYAELEQAIIKTAAEMGLQLIATQVQKVLQLYEAMNQRMGVVLVGPSGSGKSTLLKILRKALELLGITVPLMAVNPKAMSRRQLLGYMDPDTREWTDGVLTAAARSAVKKPTSSRPWILCDGDIDPEWIESLNSVLDDNKLLTLPNGVRIQFESNVNFIFETHSLEFASPATVSRMGVIFFSDKDIHLEAVVESVMSKHPEESRKRLLPLIMKYVFTAIDEVISMEALSVPTTRMGLLNACFSHVIHATEEDDFIYSLIRGLGSALKPHGAVKIAKFLYDHSTTKPQSENRPLDTYWDSKKKGPREFTADLNVNISAEDFAAGRIPVIGTVEVQRLSAILAPLVESKAHRPIFLVGPEGCGKGSMLQHCFAQAQGIRTTTINCSSQTTSMHIIQKIEQLCTVFNTTEGRVYRPKECERLVLILKNINLPKPDRYGTVELHAFLQQLIMYAGFYTKELEWIGVERIQVVASMNPSVSAGRYPVVPRLLAIVNVVSMTYPSKTSLLQIYTTYWGSLLRSTNIGQGKDYENGHQLAQFVISVYERMRKRFEGEEYAHISYSPRHITSWVSNVLRYKIDAQTTLPAVLAYEADRIFLDCLPTLQDRARAEKILADLLATIGYSAPSKGSAVTMFVTWFSDPPVGRAAKLLEQHKFKEVAKEVEASIISYGREFRDLTVHIIPPIIMWTTCADRVLALPGGHLIVVGRPGIGRRDAVILAAYTQRMEIVTINMSQDYQIKNFRLDLRGFIQRAVTQNTRLTFILEDQHLVNEAFVELLNSLVCSGEVPGLFTAEEMEIMYSPLREEAASEGFIGPITAFFHERLLNNLHVAFIMDNEDDLFLVRLQSNPGLLTKCEILWMGTWSADVAKTLCKERLKDNIAALEADPKHKGFHLHRELMAIHESITTATPKDFEVLMSTYTKIVDVKCKSSEANIVRLETGLSKLKEAEDEVEEIKKDVAKKKEDVEVMQREADNALNEIQKNMQDSQEQRDQATELQEELKEEHEDIIVNRQKSEEELSSIKPLMEAARDAVSSIRSEQLNEIRFLKNPPEPIRDVLEGVLALLGVNDVSWQSMRNFLGERGVKERILAFDVKNVTPAIRSSVSRLLQQKATSFKPEVIHRASVAAAPMAEWVTAMVQYSTIMERIAPLTRQLEQLETNQRAGEERLEGLTKKLNEIDHLVEGLREEFSKKVKEAERLRGKLTTAEEELHRAEELLDKLSGEKKRWATEAADIREANHTMPKRAILSAAFMVYLPAATEGVRQEFMKKWSERLGFKEAFSITNFLRTESDLLQYKSEGLPGDDLSLENSIVMLDTVQVPLVVDPANQAIEWVKTHLVNNNVIVEVVSLHDERFSHTLELAVRFGKTLLVTEVTSIEPILYPVLRKDLISAGAKRVVQVGSKAVDWQDTFHIMLFSRSTDMKLPPSALSLVSEVNFSVTSFGLESQLLGITIQHEQPELETQKVDLLQKEQSLKLELSKLESKLLNELADSHGNLMENTQLISSLNTVKVQASTIQASLKESHSLQGELDEKREVYRPFAKSGASIFFLVKDLEKVNRMYQFGLPDFIDTFVKTLSTYKGADTVAKKISALVKRFAQITFHRVSLGLLKRDRVVFGLHFLQGMFPDGFPSDLWDAMVGASKTVDCASLPPWAPASAKHRFGSLMSFPRGKEVVDKWRLEDTAKWTEWMGAAAPETMLDKEMPTMDRLLFVNTFRPDRMSSLSMALVLGKLRLDTIVPTTPLEELILSNESASPILLITSSGADPSMEVQDVAINTVGRQRFIQIALGGGQTDEAMQQLRRCAAQGDWIFLKNLHLVLDWAYTLEKELCAMPVPNPDFRLIITTEEHDSFPSVLLRMSTKITVEAPPGVKQNLMRTYTSWDRSFLEAQPQHTAQLLFGLAWFHAIIQERRNFVPQGWVKFYEFSPADLKAAMDILVTLGKGGQLDWETLTGFLATCVYGGRLDNPQDGRVLQELIATYFTEEVLIRGKVKLFEDLTVPPTNNHDSIVHIIAECLPDVDSPDLLKLPDNADRVVLETWTAENMEQLRSLRQRVAVTEGGTSDSWKRILAPVLETWKNSGVSVSGPRRTIASNNTDPDPMEVFFVSEINLLSQLILDLTAYMETLGSMAEGTLIPGKKLRQEALELIGGRIPSFWLDRMDGPKEFQLWLSLLSRKYTTTVTLLREPMSSSTVYNLTSLLRPATFFNALRQYTARQSKAPLVDLVLVAAIGAGTGPASALQVSVSVKASTICLQGAAIGSDNRLRDVSPNSPSSTPLSTNIVVGWMPSDRLRSQGYTTIPVYDTQDRQKMLFPLSVPYESSADALKYSLNGVACFLAAV